jgi:hypothetical protein
VGDWYKRWAEAIAEREHEKHAHEPHATVPIAKLMAYGGGNSQPSQPFEVYRLRRGFPFQRAGGPVTVASTFQSLSLSTGSAVGLHQPVNQNALTNGLLDPSKSGFLQKGSNVQALITIPFTFNATSTTALTISWPATALRRANRTLLVSFDTAIPAGSISITGLVANIKYYFYPYWSENSKVVGWAGAGGSLSAGSPAIAQTAQSDVTLQQQNYQGFRPLNVCNFTMPAAGTLSQTGGYGTGLPNLSGIGYGQYFY